MRSWFLLLSLSLALIAPAQELRRRPILGLPLQALPAEQATKLGFTPQSAAIVKATGALPGDVKDGDILTAVNGHKFTSFAEMNGFIREMKAGDKVKLSVLADGKEATREITLPERPRDPGDATYEVLYDSVSSNGHQIRTIVSKPKTPGKHPVLFWIQGINVGSVDFLMTAKNYMAPILKSFSDGGFVTVRVEKTGVGDSEGGPAMKVGFNEENDIYRQALKDLGKYDFVDRERVYVFGHSMGGCHAPIIASEMPVKGIISYGTVSDSWLEWQIKADRWQPMLGGGDPAQIDRDVRKTVTFYGELYNDKKSIEQIVKDHPDLADFAKQQSPDGQNLSGRSIAYMQEVNDKNFSDYWGKVGDAKVLALFGEFDFVSLQGDQTQIPVVVNRAKPGNASFQVVKASDHLFSHSSSFKESIDNFGRLPFDPEIIRVCKEWIKSIG